MRKTYLILLMGLLLISAVAAEAVEELPPAKQGEDYRIKQVCQDATYINISSVTYPNSTFAFANINMTGAGSGEYFFDLNKTDALGRYDVTGISDGCTNTFATYFLVTPSGQSGTANIVFAVLIILMLYGISFFGFFGRNETMTLLGGMALMFLGVYLIVNGVIVYRDDLTRILSMVTIAWGAVSSLMAGMSWIE